MWPRQTTVAGGYGDRDFDDRSVGGLTTSLTMTEMLSLMRDGGTVISVTIGVVSLRKVVYDDGRFHVLVEEGRDRIAMAGSAGRASLTYGAESVAFVSDTVSHAVARAREVIGAAKVIATFRQLIERMGRAKRISAGAVSIRLTEALCAEIAGEAGVAAQYARLVSAFSSAPHSGHVNDGNEFHERWAQHVLRTTGVPTRPPDSLASSLEALLALEASWYAVAAHDIGQSSETAR